MYHVHNVVLMSHVPVMGVLSTDDMVFGRIFCPDCGSFTDGGRRSECDCSKTVPGSETPVVSQS